MKIKYEIENHNSDLSDNNNNFKNNEIKIKYEI
jgi:hypothetical protein